MLVPKQATLKNFQIDGGVLYADVVTEDHQFFSHVPVRNATGADFLTHVPHNRIMAGIFFADEYDPSKSFAIPAHPVILKYPLEHGESYIALGNNTGIATGNDFLHLNLGAVQGIVDTLTGDVKLKLNNLTWQTPLLYKEISDKKLYLYFNRAKAIKDKTIELNITPVEPKIILITSTKEKIELVPHHIKAQTASAQLELDTDGTILIKNAADARVLINKNGQILVKNASGAKIQIDPSGQVTIDTPSQIKAHGASIQVTSDSQIQMNAKLVRIAANMINFKVGSGWKGGLVAGEATCPVTGLPVMAMGMVNFKVNIS